MVRTLIGLACLALTVMVGVLLYQRLGGSVPEWGATVRGWVAGSGAPPGQTVPPGRDARCGEKAPVVPERPAQSPPSVLAPPAVTSPAPVGGLVQAAPELPPQVTIGKRTHIVQPGETLWDISRYYYGAAGHVERIADANSLDAPKRIYPGMVLVLPEIAGVRMADPPASQRSSAEQRGPATAPPEAFAPMPPTLNRNVGPAP